MSDAPFRVVPPIAVTNAMLVATDVPEADYAAIAATTTYAAAVAPADGSRVISTSTHSIYECILGFTTPGVPVAPELDPTHWLRVSATNRWKIFDLRNSSRTAQADNFYYRLQPGVAINTLDARGLVGCTSVRVRLTDPTYGVVYDQTVSTAPVPPASDWWSLYFGVWTAGAGRALFEDLPAFPNAELRIDFTGTSALAVGALVFGQVRAWGRGVQYGVRLGIQDYSTKDTNRWGDLDLVEGGFADRATFNVQIRNTEVDALKAFLATLRAAPALYIGSGLYEATSVLGIFKDFDILIPGPTWADCDINLLGTT